MKEGGREEWREVKEGGREGGEGRKEGGRKEEQSANKTNHSTRRNQAYERVVTPTTTSC